MEFVSPEISDVAYSIVQELIVLLYCRRYAYCWSRTNKCIKVLLPSKTTKSINVFPKAQ